jgi:hypothetical protein
VQGTLRQSTSAFKSSLPEMASASMPASLQTPSDTTSDMLLPSKPIHSRRTSRNPNLAPLPAFTFNSGAMDSMKKDEQSSPAGSGLENEANATESRRASPPPLPAFSFNPGAATQPASDSSSPTHPILEEMAQHRSRRTSKPAALPPFSFNPGAREPQKTPSPTKPSFTSDPPGSARSIGHRRGASEFIGAADGAQPASTVPFSASPQRSSHGPPVTGYVPPRLSHQHRRSQAVSITEIETSDLIKINAVAKHRTGPPPSTPTDLVSNDHFSRASQSISSLYGRTPPTSPRRRASATGARPRVLFSDTIDVIPRPLSLISSETEGSTSTLRGNHSLTGSITSLGSPAARCTSSPILDDKIPVQRPKTADSASPQLPQRDELEKSGLPKRPFSASDSTGLFTSSGSPASKKRFWFTSGGSAETSPIATPKHTPNLERTDPITLLTPVAPVEHMTNARARPKTSPERRTSIKKRKVRTIAGALFSRKARSRGSQSRGRRTVTPPLGLSRSFSNELTDSVFDDDSTVIITNSSTAAPERPQVPTLDTNLRQQSPPSSSYDDDYDARVTSPVIDLDAALGPFGSEKHAQTGFAAARNRMHSSVGRGMPDAFGVVHRRAESAPQMPPINRSMFGIHRLGSNTNVAEEVFDEEEEDDFLAEVNKPRAESEIESVQGGAGIRNASSCSDMNTVLQTNDSVRSISPSGLAISFSTEVPDSVAIVDDEEDAARETARSSGSTLSAPTMPEVEVKQASSSPLTFAYPAPQASYASSGEGRSAPSSAISSPDADHINFDNYPRISRHMGELSPDLGLRSSTDDVPSLCDSVSTGNAPRFSSGAVTQYSTDQCSNSFSPPSTGRSHKSQQAWKRASLASLNRLIPGSSHGEKSRLRFEESAAHEQEEKARKKGNRISRLMSFWRSKEKENK